jgi:hypothetical protein
MEVVPLCYVLNTLHLLRRTKHMYLNCALHVSYMFRPKHVAYIQGAIKINIHFVRRSRCSLKQVIEYFPAKSRHFLHYRAELPCVK